MSDQQIQGTTEAEKVLSSDLLIGTVFETRFEIHSVLGTGGSATAYKATDVHLLRPVALKIIHAFLLSQEKSIERFMREAKTCTLLDHDNIAKVYMSGVASDGRPYMVMDLLEGKTLAQIIKESGPLNLDRFFLLFRQLIAALSYAHSQKVIHRDLKPSNIVIVESNGQEAAILVDFGIAKIIDQEKGQSSTQTGALLGSTHYMSPEQCIGGQIDERTDIYSLGCVMIEALTGKAPYEGESAFDVMYKHLNESLGHLSFLKEMPEAVGAMIGKCLQKKPELRYQSMDELKEDFDRCALLDTSQRRWKSGAAPAMSNLRQYLILGLPILFVMVVAGNYFYWRQHTATQNKDKDKDLLAAVALKKKAEKAQEPAKDVVPRRNLQLLTQKLKQYPDANDKIIILNNWIKKWDSAPRSDEQPFERADVRFYLGEAYITTHQYDKAAAVLDEAVKLDRNRPDIEPHKPLALAQTYRHRMRPKEALAMIEAARKRYGTDLEQARFYGVCSKYYALEGDCWLDLGDFEKANSAFEKACKVGDMDKGGLRAYQDGYRGQRIRCLLRLGRRDEIPPLVYHEFMKSCEQKDAHLVPSDIYIRAAEFCSANGANDLALRFLKDGEAYSRSHHNQKLDLINLWYAQIQAASQDPETRMKNAIASSEKSTDFYTKVSALNTAAMVIYATHPEKGKSLTERCMHLLRQHLTVDPDFFWKNSNPGYDGIVGFRCDVLENLGFYDKAREECQFWISNCRGNACENLVGLYETEAKAYQFANRIDDALASNQKALNLLQGDRNVQAEIDKNRRTALHMRIATAFAQRANLLNMQARFAESEKCIRTAIETLEADPFASGHKSSLYGILGGVLEQEKKFQEADDAFKKMLSWINFAGRSPNNNTAFEIRLYSNYLIRQKRFAEADQFARLALKHVQEGNPGPADAPIFRAFWLDLGTNSVHMSKLNEAMSFYKKIYHSSVKSKKFDHLYHSSLTGIADVYCRKGEFDKAIEPLQNFVLAAPPQARAAQYKWLADCYAHLKKPEERFAALRKAVKVGLEVNDRSVEQQERMKELAKVYQERGEQDEASRLITHAQKLSSP